MASGLSAIPNSGQKAAQSPRESGSTQSGSFAAGGLVRGSSTDDQTVEAFRKLDFESGRVENRDHISSHARRAICGWVVWLVAEAVSKWLDDKNAPPIHERVQ